MQVRSGATQIAEIEAKEILRAYGFNVLEGHLARTTEEAVDIADRIGYPGGAEDFLAGHHSQIRLRRGAHQSRQRRTGARRLST